MCYWSWIYGLPLAIEFSKKYKTIGFDKKESRINQLLENMDVTGEISCNDLKCSALNFTTLKEDIEDYNVYIIAVPTPIDSSKNPDLKFLKSASRISWRSDKKEDIVIYESQSIQGVQWTDCVPILEKYSSLKLNEDFCGYRSREN